MPRSTLQPFPAEELRHPDARWLSAYAASKVVADEILTSDAIVLHEARGIVAHLMVLRPGETPDALLYGPVGDAITTRFGVDLTGRTLDLSSSGGWAPAMKQALDERRPIALRGEVPGGQASWARLEALILPVDCANGKGTGILAGLFFL